MRLELTDEQAAAARELRRLLEKHCTPGVVRAQRCTPGLWSELAGQGWLGLPFAAEVGGGEGSLLDLGVVYEEAGRALLPTGYYATLHAGLTAVELGGTAAADLVAGICAGTVRATVAAAEPHAEHSPSAYRTVAVRDDGGWRLTGRKAYVQSARDADTFLVLARTEAGRAVFLVRSDDAGLTITDHDTFGGDPQSLVDLDLQLPPDRLLGPDADAGPAIDRVEDVVTALHALEMAGGAAKVLEDTVAYVSGREQFGVPLGSFQAVQHHCANMAIALEGLRWSGWHALWLLAEHGSDREADRRAVSVAKSWADRAYPQITLTAHQLHGGAGYVTDSDLHLYSRRAKAISLRHGSEDHHLARLADQLLGPVHTEGDDHA